MKPKRKVERKARRRLDYEAMVARLKRDGKTTGGYRRPGSNTR